MKNLIKICLLMLSLFLLTGAANNNNIINLYNSLKKSSPKEQLIYNGKKYKLRNPGYFYGIKVQNKKGFIQLDISVPPDIYTNQYKIYSAMNGKNILFHSHFGSYQAYSKPWSKIIIYKISGASLKRARINKFLPGLTAIDFMKNKKSTLKFTNSVKKLPLKYKIISNSTIIKVSVIKMGMVRYRHDKLDKTLTEFENQPTYKTIILKWNPKTFKFFVYRKE